MFLYNLLYSYLETCQLAWIALQRLGERENYRESYNDFVHTIVPAINWYVVQFRTLALKQAEKDGSTFVIKRWRAGPRPLLEEHKVPINKLKPIPKGGIELRFQSPHSYKEETKVSSETILYQRGRRVRTFKAVRFSMPTLELLPEMPELVPAYTEDEI